MLAGIMGTELPGIHFKLIRKGNVIERHFACGQGQWDKYDSLEFENLPAEIYAGVFCTRHNNETLTTTKFRNIKITTD